MFTFTGVRGNEGREYTLFHAHTWIFEQNSSSPNSPNHVQESNCIPLTSLSLSLGVLTSAPLSQERSY